MKVFLSAYACEPGKGSEPGVGWRWACGLASRVELQVLTRESNRKVIEQAIAATPEGDRLRTVKFHFHDLPQPFLTAKRLGILPTLAYYALWQGSVARRFTGMADEAQVVHHLTFCTLLCPGFWKLKRAAFVLGPVGAPLVNPDYLPLFGCKARIQQLRGWIMGHFPDLPWLRKQLQNAAVVVPANSETRQLLISHGIPAREVILDTGAPEPPLLQPRRSQAGPIQLMYAGQLERRKGLELSLKALAVVPESCEWAFDVFGSGPDLPRLRAMARELNIDNRVCFHGSLPHADLMRKFDIADAFLFTSVRDTSGGVNLEAMAHELPIVCIAHQGVGDVTNDACAERIMPGSIEQTIRGLAEAVVRLASDPNRRLKMGSSARTRAIGKFSWDEKFDRMCQHYREAIETTSTPRSR